MDYLNLYNMAKIKFNPLFTEQLPENNLKYVQPSQSLSVREIIQMYGNGYVASHVNNPTDEFNTDHYTEEELLNMSLSSNNDKLDLYDAFTIIQNRLNNKVNHRVIEPQTAIDDTDDNKSNEEEA